MMLLYVSHARGVRAGGLIAFAAHSSSHSPNVRLFGATKSPLFAEPINSANLPSASRFVPLKLTHVCFRMIAPVFLWGPSPLSNTRLQRPLPRGTTEPLIADLPSVSSAALYWLWTFRVP